MIETEEDNPSDQTNQEILICLRKEMAGILTNRPVMLAYLHGSVADGSSLPSSDVDIALVLERGYNPSAYGRMQMEFEIASDVERRCQIREADVRSINHAPLTVQGKVLTEGTLLYSRDEEYRVDYEVRTRKLYFDFMPVAEMMRSAFLARLRKEGLSGGKARED